VAETASVPWTMGRKGTGSVAWTVPNRAKTRDGGGACPLLLDDGSDVVKKLIVVLCMISSAFGATVAVMILHPPETQQPILAQDAARPAASPSGLQPFPQAPPVSEADLTPDERVNVAVYENVNRSVVNVTTTTVQSNRIFMLDVPSEGKGEGSGIVIDRNGHILTNLHVVEDAREVQVTLYDGKTYEATPVGHDPVSDTAVLKIDAPAESLFPVVFGNSGQLLVGQRVFAIGNPFGFERTLTTGIISSLNRSLPARRSGRTIKSLIQIDAAINPGNSGGPLLDTQGRMIGMNTAIASRSGDSAGVGFAIPINTIARVVPQLVAGGRVVRADIGILTVYHTPEGLRIRTLAPGGPAERAGLKGPQIVVRRKRQGPITYDYKTVDRLAADLIVAVDGQKVVDGDEFLTHIESKQPGDEVVLTVIREGREVPIRVKLDAGGE
jgi:S1-C subfamily serine protease